MLLLNMDFYVANHLVNLSDFWTFISAEPMRNVHYIIYTPVRNKM